MILLLCGGDRTTEDADINTAISDLQDWKKRDHQMTNETTTTRCKGQSHDEIVAEMLRTDPHFRAAMTNEIMVDGDFSDLLIFLRQLVLAEGGMKVIADRSGLNEAALELTMSAEGNSSIKTFAKLLESLNLRIAVVPRDSSAPSAI